MSRRPTILSVYAKKQVEKHEIPCAGRLACCAALDCSLDDPLEGGDMINGQIYLIAETGALKCGACGQQYQVAYPLPVEDLCRIITEFENQHEDCVLETMEVNQ